ncbi:peptidase S41 [Candidatus Saccharibacteria bacterium]|nr:MAG: peptidase S41 [Candidatus Saccharibacteria bacterium]
MNNVRGKNHSGWLLTLAIVSMISFVAGMRSDAIFSTVAPVFGVRVSTDTIDTNFLQETYRKFKANYDGKIDEQALIYGASRGMVAAAGDEYSMFMDPKESEEFEKSVTGNIGGGIGAEIGRRDKQPVIVRPLKNSPAMKSGIQAGDLILAVNDEVVTNLTASQVARKIRGDIGTTVKLTLSRSGDTKEFSVTRQEIIAPAVESKIQDGVGILTVSMFNDDTVGLARSAATQFKDKKVKRVILDLRGNPGGTVEAARGLAGIWLDNKTVMTERRDGEIIKTAKSIGPPILQDVKTVVLINGGSASASEIVAGALRDYNKAKLVGEKSYGKGSVQALINLSNGSQLKVTEARWFTPKGHSIDKKGIEPDKKVKLTAKDFNAGRDPQLEAAKKLK